MTRYAFVAQERTAHAVRRLCTLIGASVSGFYDWLARAKGSRQSPRKTQDQALLERIKPAFEEAGGVYGSPRIHAELKAQGVPVGRKRVARLMAKAGLSARPKRRAKPRTTDSRHDFRIAPNLLAQNFRAERPDTVWLADITYVATDEGWLYLAAIKDMATMEIVGWAADDHLRAELCLEALDRAIARRKPAPGLIHHSDRGSQYACTDYVKRLKARKIVPSMSAKGNCYDNAPMESWFGSLKTECVYRTRFKTRDQARTAIFRYIEVFYNRKRRHSALGYRTPIEAWHTMTRAA